MKQFSPSLAKTLLLMLFLMSSAAVAICQNEIAVSRTVTEYNNKTYYLHRVEGQQTLAAIAKAYGIPAESIMIENPEVRNGLRNNQVLRIPVSKATKGTELPKNPPQHAGKASDEYDYVYHVAGRDETYHYLSLIYLVQESLIRSTNKGLREPFREGEYVLIPISKKQAPASETESRFKRSGYDPYLQSNPKAQSLPDPKQLATETKIVTVSPFDSPLNPVSPPENNSRLSGRSAGVVMPEMPADESVHVVKPNETIQSIAIERQISQEALLAANPGASTGLRTGQVLKIPDTKKPVLESRPQASNTIEADTFETHTVAKGETLFRISRQYGVALEILKEYNPGLSETISVGQKIRIPKKKTTDSYLIYKVTERQKAKTLANNFGLSPEELQKANPSMGSEVFPNQKLHIPLERKAGVHPVQPSPEPDHKEAEPASAKAGDAVAETEKTGETSDCEADTANGSKEFKIALLIPLYLDRVDMRRSTAGTEENLKQSMRFLSFYKGFILAADSMAKANQLRTVIQVFDVDQNSAKLNSCLQDPWMKQADLIVGPFHSQPFAKVAEFAKNKGILIVNPMSNRREILVDNPYVIKIKPDISNQYAQLATLIADRYPNAKIFIYHSRSTYFAEQAADLQKVLAEKIPFEIKVRNSDLARRLRQSDDLSYQVYSDGKWLDLGDLQIHENEYTNFSNEIEVLAYDRDSLRYLRKNGSAVRNNIVIALGDERVFAMEFMNKLNQVAEKFPIKFIGLPEWDKFDNLFVETLQRLDAHFFNDGFIAFDQPSIKSFIAHYRNEFETEPDEYSFEGFDISWAFLNYLKRFGPGNTECLSKESFHGLQTDLHFKQLDADSGFENMYWNIYKLENYSIQPLRNAFFYP